MMPMTCAGSILSSRRTRCFAIVSVRRVSSCSTCASSSSSGFASMPMIASSAASLTSTSAMRARSSASPLRTPSTWPSLNPCSHASRSTSVRCMTLTPFCPGRGSGAPSTEGRSQRLPSDMLLALAPERDRARVRELARGDEDFLLRRLDIREPHRALRFEIGLEHLRRALRHVLEHLRLEGFVDALERDEQFVRGHLAQQLLHAAIVDLDEVVEHEHQVLDALREALVGLADVGHERGADGRIEQVHHLRRDLEAAERGALAGAARGRELLFHHLVEL